ncbi:hypothetical protein C8R47DRAFT_1169392 [Mycena vitilis]|nr:hypothetical protein C8R47DRAFT_1169392 [Mycena vitilis]
MSSQGLSFEELLANLSLENDSPRPSSPSRRTTRYYFESPTKRGYTDEWSVAGAATQGVENAHVHRVQKAQKKRKNIKAYVVFVGRVPGVHPSWRETANATNGVSGAIHRGYRSDQEAEDAFAYAEARGWTRVSPGPVAAIHTLPTPLQATDSDAPNPLNGCEELDNTWFVVFRGITPGVYRSLLEALLNTVGIPNATYQTVEGRDNAFRTFAKARGLRDTSAAPPPAYRR